MLAKTWNARYWNPRGMFVQPKLNGVRAMYSNGNFVSRDGLLWSPKCLGHVREALAKIPPQVILDGELYCHGLSLQQINSRIAVNRNEPHNEESKITYCVFDLVSAEGFAIRQAELFLLFQSHIDYDPSRDAPVSFVETRFAGVPKVADQAFMAWRHVGFEGMMLRCPDGPYSVPDICGNKENRSHYLLKRKDWLDLDAEIVEVTEGQHRLQGTCGSLALRYKNDSGGYVYFAAGSGLSDMSRRELWEKRDLIREDYFYDKPWTAKVKYEMLSDGGVPLKPTIILINEL